MGVDSVMFLLISSKESKSDETWGDLKRKSEVGCGEIVCGAGGHEEKDEIPAVSALGQEDYKLETSLGFLYSKT